MVEEEPIEDLDIFNGSCWFVFVFVSFMEEQKMKVLHVITSLRTGGAEKLMVDLLPRMKQKGYEVDLCVFDGTKTPFYEELEHRGINILPLHKKGGMYSVWNAYKLVSMIRNYDIVHAHNTPAQICTAIANRFVKTRLITTEHSTNNRRRGKWWLKALDNWLYRQFECIICVSDIAAENIKSYVESDDIHTITIPNGINTKEYEDAIPSRNFIEKFFGIKRIAMVAGFRYEKDQNTVIRAVSFLPQDYHLFLIGDGDRRNELEQLVGSWGLKERVHFLGIRKDVNELLKAMDVVVMSSHREGLSLSSLEGMASGKPFVASDVEGLREIVGGYGVLFPHEDEHALAESIKHVCEDKVYAAQVAERCQHRARQFDIEVMAKKYMDLYL